MPNSFYSQLRNLIDPGMVSGYYPQTLPGHPAAQEFDWREAAPPGAGLIGLPMAGAFAGYRLNTSSYPGRNSLYVHNVELDSPTEGIRALRDLYQRATKARVPFIQGYPLSGNKGRWGERGMRSMIDKLGRRLGLTIKTADAGSDIGDYMISVEKLGEFLRRNPNR